MLCTTVRRAAASSASPAPVLVLRYTRDNNNNNNIYCIYTHTILNNKLLSDSLPAGQHLQVELIHHLLQLMCVVSLDR